MKEFGLAPKMRMVSFAFAGVQPEIMGIGPIPSTEKALKKAGLTIADIGLFELNEAFAIQVISLLDHFGIADDDPASTSGAVRSRWAIRSRHPACV